MILVDAIFFVSITLLWPLSISLRLILELADATRYRVENWKRELKIAIIAAGIGLVLALSLELSIGILLPYIIGLPIAAFILVEENINTYIYENKLVYLSLLLTVYIVTEAIS